MTIVEFRDFLKARLDDDEAVARAVVDDLHGGDCDLSENEAERHEVWEPHPGGDCPTGWQTGDWTHNHLSGPSSLFIRHTSPERALREVEAKRRTLGAHEPVTRWDGRLKCGKCASMCHSHSGLGCDEPYDAPWPCDEIRNLASVYADHEDFREEWQP